MLGIVINIVIIIVQNTYTIIKPINTHLVLILYIRNCITMSTSFEVYMYNVNLHPH